MNPWLQQLETIAEQVPLWNGALDSGETKRLRDLAREARDLVKSRATRTKAWQQKASAVVAQFQGLEADANERLFKRVSA